ncbi:hypothetical protein GCM10010994_35010 [Chelatococcus reniformis]|uniref:Uncharacterized protein n=2 Tax=Chelatococcus reniformis TaxID=1494448 RepID=A0A916UJY1_9HYPH|nr:hypothetical protein GCM10010994_35010 [Chelatococcus reniformis]
MRSARNHLDAELVPNMLDARLERRRNDCQMVEREHRAANSVRGPMMGTLGHNPKKCLGILDGILLETKTWSAMAKRKIIPH